MFICEPCKHILKYKLNAMNICTAMSQVSIALKDPWSNNCLGSIKKIKKNGIFQKVMKNTLFGEFCISILH